MAKIPDKAEHQRAFAGLETRERRAIIKAVNRGKAVENRRHAALAVGVARRQQRFWRLGWLLGPVVGLSGFVSDADATAVLLNTAFATAVLGLMAWFWYSRARKSEHANLEVALDRSGRHRSGGTGDAAPTGGQRLRSHLPGGGGAAGAVGGGAAAGSGSSRARSGGGSPPPGQRPYKPRGRKRR